MILTFRRILFSLLLIIIFYLTTGCNLISNKQSIVLKRIEMTNANCKIEKDIDSHGGFLGDGDYFAKIKCFNINYSELSSHWKKLPLSETLNHVTQMKQCDNKGCNNIYDRFSIPNIKDGYYYFLDRHSESEDIYDDTNLNNRASWNFTLAIIDKNSNIIYYYELDT